GLGAVVAQDVGQDLQGGCLGLVGGVAAGVLQDRRPRFQVVGDVVGGLAGVVSVFLPVGVDEGVDGGVPAAVHLDQFAVAAQADRGPDADRAVAEDVVGDFQGDGVDVVAGEVV